MQNYNYLEYVLRNKDRLLIELKNNKLSSKIGEKDARLVEKHLAVIENVYSNLNAFEKETVTLRYKDGMLLKEIAHYMNYSYSTIKSIFQKYRQAILLTIK